MHARPPFHPDVNIAASVWLLLLAKIVRLGGAVSWI